LAIHGSWPGASMENAMTEHTERADRLEANRTDDHPPRTPGDGDLLHGGSGEQGPPDGPTADEATDDLLNGGSGENEPPAENEPPIKVRDGQVYGG
jgi:hypothetical protein